MSSRSRHVLAAALQSQAEKSPDTKFGWAQNSRPVTAVTPRRERSPANEKALEQERINASPHVQPAIEIRPPPSLDTLRDKYKRGSLGLNKELLYPARPLAAAASESWTPIKIIPTGPYATSGHAASPNRPSTELSSSSLLTSTKPRSSAEVKPRPSKSLDTPKWLGVVNQGNTCFAAAALQFLAGCHQFVELLSPRSSSEPLHTALHDFFTQLSTRSTSAASATLPDVVKRLAPHFFDGRQHDSHEFLIELFSQLDAERGEDWPMKLFGTTMAFTTTCDRCGATSTTQEHVAILSCPCPQPDAGVVTLDGLLEGLTTQEIIAGCKCDKCHESVNMTRISSVERLPEWILCHIMRFETGSARKIRTAVQTPLQLNLNDWEGPHKFSAASAVLHKGRQLHSGHYTSLTSRGEGTWLLADDTHVAECDPKIYLDASSDVVMVSFKR